MKITQRDKLGMLRQLREDLSPSQIVDAAFDTKRMVFYAAVAFHGNGSTPDGYVFGLVSRIFKCDDYDRRLGDNFYVSTDSMVSETMGIADNEEFCHCPQRLLKKLSPTQDECALAWREVCTRNSKRKTTTPNSQYRAVY